MSVELESEAARQAEANAEAAREPAVEENRTEDEEFVGYRSLSAMAVASAAVGGLSILAFVNESLALVPVVGLLLGLRAHYKIRRNPEELTGLKVANLGILASAGFLLASWAWMGYVYATEVPPGFERLSYALLKADENTPDQLIPPSAKAWEGKKVFLKGYMHPVSVDGGRKTRLKSFVMVPDSGQCCFGTNQPKLTDMVHVEFEGNLRVNYRDKREIKVAGTFEIKPHSAGELGAVVYHLAAEYAQ